MTEEADDVTHESKEVLDGLIDEATSTGKTLTKSMIADARNGEGTAGTPSKPSGAGNGNRTTEKDLEESKKSSKPMKTVRYADVASLSSQRTATLAETSTITKEEEDVTRSSRGRDRYSATLKNFSMKAHFSPMMRMFHSLANSCNTKITERHSQCSSVKVMTDLGNPHKMAAVFTVPKGERPASHQDG